MKKSFWLWTLALTLLTPTCGFSQTATTSLRGTIKDPSGALVPNATITLSNSANGQTRTATADSTGNYAFPQLMPATYTITVAAAGFGNQSKTAALLVNQPATVNFTLSIQSSAVTVDVSAAAQTLNTSDASLGNSVGNNTIQALPMEGRNPISLLTLQPGVLYLGDSAENSTVDTRSGSVSGGRSDQGNVTVDGIDDNFQLDSTALYEGAAFQGVLRSTLDSTEEFRVTTSNGTAEAGRSSGAEISLVTKSGTNQFHGAAYEYYRPTNTVANQWFNKESQLASGEPNIPEKYVLNTFGSSLGGPIKKDKLFFFANYEGLRQAVSQIIGDTLPTAAFYAGEVGYTNTSGVTEYLPATGPNSVTSYDAGCAPTGTPSVPCGPNPNVYNYYEPLQKAGFIGTSPSLGDGINSAGFFFPSPNPTTQNTTIVKADYILSNTQHLFIRGNLQKDTTGLPENLPGQPPQTFYDDNTKGLAAGHTWTPTANIVNDLRYGFVRQGYADRGIGSGTGDWVNFRFLTQPTSDALSEVISVPVQNIVDTLTWNKGNHTLTFGGNWRNIVNNRSSDEDSYTYASTNPEWLSAGPPEPADLSPGSYDPYLIAFATIVGTVPETGLQENYAVSSATSGKLIPDGTAISRHFKSNEFEYYIQDSWRVRPNITVNYGLHQSILGVPYETHGQQVAPTIDTFQWFLQRGQLAAEGLPDNQGLSFAPSGKANGGAGYWAKQKDNLAPRLSVAWAPNSTTSLRAGAGMYYDHFGEAIVNTFDETGSFGLSSTIISGASTYSEATAPRFTGPHNIPPLAGASCGVVSATTTFPSVPPSGTACGFTAAWGIDNHVKTPYSYDLDASLQIELPGGFTFEEAYVGRFGRHLLQQLDLAEPTDLVDNGGGGDYFTAASALSKLVDEHGGNYGNSYGTAPNGAAPVHVPTIQYFEDMFPQMAGYDFPTESATEAVYNNEWAPNRFVTGLGETTALQDLDINCYYGCPQNNGNPRFTGTQYASLYAWSSIGTSSYNALQMTLRHPASHGLTVDVNYTLSRSSDLGSGTEIANWQTADAFGESDAIQNSWNPKLNKAVSDFDTRNLVSLDWVYELPVGRNKTFLSNSNRLVDALIGNIQWSGLSRWSSGLPFGVFETGYTTNWQLAGTGVVTGNVQVGKHIVNGAPQVFAGNSASVINNGIYNGTPIRYPYPGEAGQRNHFRGDGYFDIDSSLSKEWGLGERVKLKVDAEVYNVTNTVRFDDSSLNLQTSLSSGNFGYYSGTLSVYRRMQFGARIDF